MQIRSSKKKDIFCSDFIQRHSARRFLLRSKLYLQTALNTFYCNYVKHCHMKIIYCTTGLVMLRQSRLACNLLGELCWYVKPEVPTNIDEKTAWKMPFQNGGNEAERD